jgi:hypothetical protein
MVVAESAIGMPHVAATLKSQLESAVAIRNCPIVNRQSPSANRPSGN